MESILERLIQTIEKNAIDNKATITDVKLWAKSWRNEMQTEQKLNKHDVMRRAFVAGQLNIIGGTGHGTTDEGDFDDWLQKPFA